MILEEAEDVALYFGAMENLEIDLVASISRKL